MVLKIWQKWIEELSEHQTAIKEAFLELMSEKQKHFDSISKKDISDVANINRDCLSSLLDGWMYGCGFADSDGHRWNALYMDMSKMPQ
ncbi:hypothetical protein [Bacillus sp. OV322]|uniref:hypothetical protein n=1 Tax=Bacillus sp. OV322 TaxID=1882764 RepID=UPI00210AD124|nr:hypothetical protein [Bacillus sp. OV322]